jgi:hypothetical protein
MITITVVKSYVPATARARVTAASIERALQLAGEGARVEFPIDPEAFFTPADSAESIEEIATPAPAVAAA